MKKTSAICFLLLICFIKSVNAQLWTEQQTNSKDPILQIDFLDNSYGWALPSYFIVQANFYILRTTDGGTSWQKIIYMPQDAQFREFQFINSSLGYARGKNKFYKTTDGGKNWVVVHEIYDPGSIFDWPSSSMSFINGNTGYISYYYGIYKTTDAGNSWMNVLNDKTSSTTKISFYDEKHGWACTAFNRDLYKTNDGGITWNKVRDYSQPIKMIDSISGYARGVYSAGDIIKTSDDGVTWKSITSTSITALKFNKLEGFINMNSRDSINHTINAGNTWSSIPTKIVPDFDVTSIAFYGKDIWLGGFTGKIYKMNLQPDIELKSLLNTETLFAGDVVNILWNPHNIDATDKCKIEFSQNNGQTWSLLADSISTLSGKYIWKLGTTLITSTECKIRISSYGTNAKAQTVNPFRIYKTAHIYVSKVPVIPFYTSGSKLPISWNADYTSSSKVTFDILITNDTLNIQPSLYDRYENTANLSDGYGEINVPYRTVFCKVRVKDSNSPLIFGETNFFKTRQLSQLSFTSPYAKHIWQADSVRQITINTVNIRSINISYSADSGSTWINSSSLVVVDSIDAHQINFAWKIPRLDSKRCLLKFESTNPKISSPAYSNIFEITQNLTLGTFPLLSGNKWFYKTSGGRYPDLYGGGTTYSYPNIYFIIVTAEEKLMDDNKKYFPFIIYRWDINSNDLIKFNYYGTNYFRKNGNQIYMYGSGETWIDFEYPNLTSNVFGKDFQTFLHGNYGLWDLVANGIGIIQPFSFNQATRSGQYQTNNIAGAIINGISYGEVLNDFIFTSIEQNNIQLPHIFSLSQNYPNPFNPSTTIKYSIPVETRHASSLQDVTLKVYDLLGREVVMLVNEVKSPGNYEVKFDGSALTSGIYFYTLTTAQGIITKKMILMK